MAGSSQADFDTSRKPRWHRDYARAPGAVVRQGGSHQGLTPPPPRPILGRAVPLAVRLMGRLPLRMAHAFGATLAALVAWLPTRERHVSRVNLRLAFPEMEPAKRHRLARRSLIETGRSFAELGAFWTWNPEKTLARIRRVDGDEVVDEAIRSKRGVILALPHLGAWELLGVYCPQRWPMTVLYRKPRMREMDEFIRGARARCGARMVAAGPGAVRQFYRTLKRGEMVTMLPDQDAGEGAGIFVPFFGHPANTMVLLSRLASRTRSLVVLAWVERLPRGGGYHVRFTPASDGVYGSDLAASAIALNADIERCVRTLPEQYLWSYKRFRIQPPGGSNPYRSR